MSTYLIDFEQSFAGTIVASAQGTITTDLGIAAPTAWDIVLVAGTDTSELTNLNSSFYSSTAMVANANGLWYNFPAFAPTGGFSETYTVNVANGPQLVFSQNYIAWTAGSTYIDLYATPNAPPTNLIGTAVPEAATWALLLLGFMLFSARRLVRWQ
jgi:hypothetical protein